MFKTNFKTILKDNFLIGTLFFVFFLVLYVFFTWILIAQGAKRCHDRGNSDWLGPLPMSMTPELNQEGLLIAAREQNYGKLFRGGSRKPWLFDPAKTSLQ